MGLYDKLNPEDQGKEFGHFIFNELPPFSAKQDELNIYVNQVQHVTIHLNHDEMKRLQ